MNRLLITAILFSVAGITAYDAVECPEGYNVVSTGTGYVCRPGHGKRKLDFTGKKMPTRGGYAFVRCPEGETPYRTATGWKCREAQTGEHSVISPGGAQWPGFAPESAEVEE